MVGVLGLARCLFGALSRVDVDSVRGDGGRLAELIALSAARGLPATIHYSVSVSEAATLMTQRHGGLLVETADCSCAGIVTPRDLLHRVVAAGLPLDNTHVGAVMTPNPDTATEDLSVFEVLLSSSLCSMHLSFPSIGAAACPETRAGRKL